MNATLHTAKHQRQRIQDCQQTDSLDFFNLLISAELLEQVGAHLSEHRERLFPPTEALSLFLTQVMNADQSCQNTVNQAAIQRVSMELPAYSTHTGAYCKARVDLVSHLSRFLGTQLSERAPDTWHWRQRRVLLADGTTVTMPDTDANQAQFLQQGGQLSGLGFFRFAALLALPA